MELEITNSQTKRSIGRRHIIYSEPYLSVLCVFADYELSSRCQAIYQPLGTGYCRDSSGALPYLFFKNGGSETQCQADCSANDWCQAFHFASANNNCAVFVSTAYSSSTPTTPSGYSITSGSFTSVSQADGRTGYSCFKKQQAIFSSQKAHLQT